MHSKKLNVDLCALHCRNELGPKCGLTNTYLDMKLVCICMIIIVMRLSISEITQVLKLAIELESQVLGLGLGLEGQVLGLGLGTQVLVNNTGHFKAKLA